MTIRRMILDPPAINRREVYRYARIASDSIEIDNLLCECISEAEPMLEYRVCWVRDDIKRGEELSLATIHSRSSALSRALYGCDEGIVFAATIGIGIDRLIAKYSRIAPSKALVLNALGAERVESLCNKLCSYLDGELCTEGKQLRPRVSPGYGDIELTIQKDIFSLLDCPRRIGLTLTDSLLMSPSKSVTAIAGIGVGGDRGDADKCALCTKDDCDYRS